ncbi:MAG: hypothetical protein ACP5XB_25005 [Isosphaeraceae bacterium]
MRRKRLIAGTLTLLLAGLLLWTGRRGGPPRPTESRGDSTPSPVRDEPATAAEGVLRGTLDAARQGDVETYLSSFGGALRQRLEHDVAARGRGAFGDDLRQAARARKGHAVYAPEPDGPDAYVITVESVYADRNERQSYRLERSSGNWLITAVATARGRTPSSKYGARADFKAPEGVPVQTDESAETLESRGQP